MHVYQEAAKRPKKKQKKQLNLLSFGDEAEDDEQAIEEMMKQQPSRAKIRSSHDVASDGIAQPEQELSQAVASRSTDASNQPRSKQTTSATPQEHGSGASRSYRQEIEEEEEEDEEVKEAAQKRAQQQALATKMKLKAVSKGGKSGIEDDHDGEEGNEGNGSGGGMDFTARMRANIMAKKKALGKDGNE